MPQKLSLRYTLALPLQRLRSKPVIPKPHRRIFQPFKDIPDENKKCFSLSPDFWPIWMVSFGEVPKCRFQPGVIDGRGYPKHLVEIWRGVLHFVEEGVEEITQHHERECDTIVSFVLGRVWWSRVDPERAMDIGGLVYEIEDMFCSEIWDE